jgi:hypothetical protein
MIFSQDRATLRRMYRDAWQKYSRGAELSPLEAQIARVVAEHPEYHELVGGDLEADFTPEQGRTNPFLHLGMHLAIREQVDTDRPSGIAAVFRSLASRSGDPLEAEHRMMEALGETLWEAQRNGTAPDEIAYLERLRRLA